ncbi:MAG: rRNA maturation RNase YbeY [Alphaproteobacteria bacterium]
MKAKTSTSKLKINFIASKDWENIGFDYKSIANSILHMCMGATQFSSIYKNIELSLKLSDDAEMQSLNKEFRGYDNPTNVLSFPNFVFDTKRFEACMAEYDGYIGDIIASLDTLERESIEQGKPLKNHYAHIICHGILHLLGYDHIDDAQANEMENIETNILNCLSIPNPY